MFLSHAETYNEIITHKYVTAEQLKFEKDMKEVTGTPDINPVSKNMKRSIHDLFNWKMRRSIEHERAREKHNSEYDTKLSRIMSAKLIDPNSERIAARLRNGTERIEDKLLREGEKIKHKANKRQEEYFQSTMQTCSPKPPSKKLNYKKILYPNSSKKPEEPQVDLDKISQIT